MPDHAFKLSASERQFLVQGIEEGLRADGRSRHDWRAFEVVSATAITDIARFVLFPGK